MYKIVVFDVETPNLYNNRICAIGITVIENGEIIYSKYSLVNPECDFDNTCIGIHGIHPKDVMDAPMFPAVWETIRDLFCSHLVAFHSGSCFDLRVLLKTLSAYDIEESLVYYIDTVTIARSMIKDTENHKLSTLCEKFCIDLEHHNAGSDSDACAKLLLCLINAGANLDKYTKSFQLNMLHDSGQLHDGKNEKQRLSTSSKSLLTLNGILAGITCDNVLVDAEVKYLQSWLDDNDGLQGNYPYDKIYGIISNALADGILTNSEREYMLGLFKQITDPVNESACGCNSLNINGKNICLTGEFCYGSKADINAILEAHGAYIHDTVKRDTDILIVGGQGSAAWAAGNYGTKVKKVLEMKSKGIDIQLIKEAYFFSTINCN
jgi:DNA polymerase III epsilon subunit-like protein